jgi:TonB family protein
MPKVIVTPNYPELARRARVWGEVKCRILIDEHGKVEKCTEVIGHPLLRDAAKKVVSEWSFSPGMKSETTIQFRFDFVNWAQECGNTQAKIELPDKVYIYTTYVPLQTSFQPPQ